MNISQATKEACKQPTLSHALSWICVWESERVVKQAHKNLTDNTPADPHTGQMWETNFHTCINSVMEAYPTQPAPQLEDTSHEPA